MLVALGSDHAGLSLKEVFAQRLLELGYEVKDLGTYSEERVDYPDFAAAVAREVAEGVVELGICVCGTGIGMSIAANKVPGIRAAHVHDVSSARMARRHNDANVACFGARQIGFETALDALEAFLDAGFDGGRHVQRIEKIRALDGSLPSLAWEAYEADEELSRLLSKELERQRRTLQLIASENFTSPAVLAAMGSVLTNKYAEGYPGKRYYGGNHVIDEVEELARERLKELFAAGHANVQPHAGANANLAAYMALVEPGDTIAAMPLSEGGHLTHGAPVSITSKLYRFVHYGVQPVGPDGTGERIDLDQLRDVARRERPKLIVAGTTAYSRIIDPIPFREIADEVGAKLMFDIAHPAGLIAGGVHPSPVGIADVVTLTTHKTLRGPRGGAILCGPELAKAVDQAVFPALQGGPLEHVIAAKAVAFREAQSTAFKAYAAQIVANAKALAAALAQEGFRIVSGGTDNHQVLVDLRTFDAELTGKQAQDALDKAGITCNRNQIPGDPRPPFIASGLRLGTPAETTAGMKEPEMAKIAHLMATVLRNPEDERVRGEVREQVAELCQSFAPYSQKGPFGPQLSSGRESPGKES